MHHLATNISDSFSLVIPVAVAPYKGGYRNPGLPQTYDENTLSRRGFALSRASTQKLSEMLRGNGT